MRMSSKFMTASIVIRTKNEGASIGNLLEKIASQQVAPPPEIVVVDSGSTDDTLNIVGRYPAKVIEIPPAQFSYGRALNLGIRNAQGAIICSVSAHCIPADDRWLHELVRPIQEERAAATFGRQIPIDRLNPFEEVSLSKHFPEDGKKEGRVPFSNANCAFLRKMWEELPFDEKIPSWEDYLWYRLLKERYEFGYCPRAVVSHTHPFSFRRIRTVAYNDGRAFRLIKDLYGIDLVKAGLPSGRSKAWFILQDLFQYAQHFARRGYVKQLFLIPVIRALVYRAYWEGYNSEVNAKIG